MTTEIKNCLTDVVLKTIDADDLRGANLRGANLRGADLRDADLRVADLRGADLRDANLRGADLRGADLRDADLRGADLRDADLRDADLYGEPLTKNPLVISSGLPWWVLITETHLRIGCQEHSHEEWAAFTEIEITNMAGTALDFWKVWKEPLLAMCKAHRGDYE